MILKKEYTNYSLTLLSHTNFHQFIYVDKLLGISTSGFRNKQTYDENRREAFQRISKHGRDHSKKEAPKRHKILVHVVNSPAYLIISEEPGPKRPIAPANCTRAPKCDASPLTG